MKTALQWARELCEGVADDRLHNVKWCFNQAMQEAYKQGQEDMKHSAALACLEQKMSFASSNYATNQPSSSFKERLACDLCFANIEALPISTLKKDDLT
jgi:hypothetical protein